MKGLAKTREQLKKEIDILTQRVKELEISEQQHLEQEMELRQEVEEWQSLTENSPDHILTLDKQLRIQFVNYPSQGLTKEDLIGTPLYSYVEKDRQLEIKKILENVLLTGIADTYETQFHVDDDRTIYYESTVLPLKSSLTDEIIGLILTARDVTERKEKERNFSVKTTEISKTLPDIIPVCANCHKVRDSNSEWYDLISYIQKNTYSRFSHGICPGCKKHLYPEIGSKE